MQAPIGRLHQNIENSSKAMKLNVMTNLSGWRTAQVLELANVSHFRPQGRRKCQTFMPFGTCKAKGVKHLPVLAPWSYTDGPPNHTTSQSASQEEPHPLAGRLPGWVINRTWGRHLTNVSHFCSPCVRNDQCFTLSPALRTKA